MQNQGGITDIILQEMTWLVILMSVREQLLFHVNERGRFCFSSFIGMFSGCKVGGEFLSGYRDQRDGFRLLLCSARVRLFGYAEF